MSAPQCWQKFAVIGFWVWHWVQCPSGRKGLSSNKRLVFLLPYKNSTPGGSSCARGYRPSWRRCTQLPRWMRQWPQKTARGAKSCWKTLRSGSSNSGDARDWKQFHSARNLATSISIESGELLELFQWSTDATLAADVEARHADLERELADVVIYALLLAHEAGVDLEASIVAKLAENDSKYPVDKARGSRDKYTEL